jgi:hypothetical protein
LSLKKSNPVPLENFIMDYDPEISLNDKYAIDLLDKMLTFNPEKR